MGGRRGPGAPGWGGLEVEFTLRQLSPLVCVLLAAFLGLMIDDYA